MQLRMLARRCPSGSMTILGDLGQATGVWAHDSWDEVLAELPQPHGSRVEEITLGYRVAKPIMDLASRVLARAAPRVSAPRSVRLDGEAPVFVRADDVAHQAALAAVRMAGDGLVAVIVPDALLAQARTALADAGADFGEAGRDGLERPITLVEA